MNQKILEKIIEKSLQKEIEGKFITKWGSHGTNHDN